MAGAFCRNKKRRYIRRLDHIPLPQHPHGLRPYVLYGAHSLIPHALYHGDVAASLCRFKVLGSGPLLYAAGFLVYVLLLTAHVISEALFHYVFARLCRRHVIEKVYIGFWQAEMAVLQIEHPVYYVRALKVYVCNVMTQDGETEGYTVSDHIRALFKHSCPGLFDLCLTNSSPIPPAVVQRYALEGAEPIFCDREAVEALGVEIISRPVATVENGLVRHNPGHLAWELVQLHNQRNIRLVCRDSHRTTCNRVET